MADNRPAARDAMWPGYAAAGVVTVLAYGIHYLPMPPFQVGGDLAVRRPVSAAIIAILVGVGIRNLLPLPALASAGCKRIVKKCIPWAIVLIGAGMNLSQIASVGPTVLCITVVCMAVAVAAAYYVGRLLGLGHKMAMLIGAGTGVCGNSAIVAVAPLIDADDEDLVLSLGTVNLFGLLAMLACPLLGGLLALRPDAFGVWAGTSIHAVPQVVAAGLAHGAEAGTLATAVKLVRVALLAPLVFLLALVSARHQMKTGEAGRRSVVNVVRMVPWFVWGFALMAVIGTLGLIPDLPFPTVSSFGDGGRIEGVKVLTQGGKVLLTLAMAAIGLEVNVRLLAGVGLRAVLTGLISSLVLGGTSLGLIQWLM